MIECSAICDEESLMKAILNKCGCAEKSLSEENAEHDYRVEQHVIAPLQNVLELEIPNINKQKRNVTKVCLDMDSAKARYQQAQKHISNTTGAAKIELIKEELKDSEQKVEQTRDILACEMFHLAARESELCYTILQYYKFQKRYHEYALSILNELIPELENEICSSRIKPVYGVDIKEHLYVTDRKIAFPIELCVCALLELGMEEEGLFRLTGATSKVKRMKLSFDAGCMTLATAIAYRDPHVIAGALKSYLRELPEPLLTHDLYDEWLNAAKAQTHPDNKLQALWTVVHKLPQANFDNLSYLIKFFHILSKNHEINKMCPHNIAIVIAPSLIWTKEENKGSSFGLNVNISLYPSIIDLLVTYADWFFDKDIDFYQTLEPIMNGELEEKASDKGIDNKGFDIKMVDKMNKSIIEKSSLSNHPCGDGDTNLLNIKRSQSINSLSEEIISYESPKPITRRKNKSVAPVPPIIKDSQKKEETQILKEDLLFKSKETNMANDKPDKPPRPSVYGHVTLPRPGKTYRENKSTETNQEDIMVQSTDNLNVTNTSQNESIDKQSICAYKKDKINRTVTTVSTNTDSCSHIKELCPTNSLKPIAAPRSVTSTIEVFEKSKTGEVNKVDLISVKKEWLLGKNNPDIDNIQLKKPAVPERPLTLKTQSFKFNRSGNDINLRNNYENISLLSNENLSNDVVDERTLQKTQIYCIDKQQVSIIKVSNESKEKNESNTNNELSDANKIKEIHGNVVEELKGDDDDKNVIVVEEKKTSPFNTSRPLSLPGADKPERPPKPDYKFSPTTSSHIRTFSDGQIIDIKSTDNMSNNNNNNNNNNNIDNNNSNSNFVKYVINNNVASELSSPAAPTIKHPQTSPPPPPVPAKPRTNSQGESTDF